MDLCETSKLCLRELKIPYRNLSCHVGFVLSTKLLCILKILMVLEENSGSIGITELKKWEIVVVLIRKFLVIRWSEHTGMLLRITSRQVI